MTTWNCKAAFGAVAVTLLSACDGGTGFALPKGLTKEAAADNVLRQAVMAEGAITMFAPDGFCIDVRSLEPRFALLARCDVLGSTAPVSDHPLAVITASFVTNTNRDAPPSPADMTQTFGAALTSGPRHVGDMHIFEASAPAPAEGLDDNHTRAQTKIGNEFLSLALFSPKGAPTSKDEAQALLGALIARLKTGS